MMERRGLRFLMTLVLILFLVLTPMSGVDARGKKKKKRRPSTGSSGPTCESLGLDCSETCCTGAECAETKLDCAIVYQRPFIELYIGFGVIIGISLSLSIAVCVGNFCLQFKFCQSYDEGSDSYIGGFSVCDALSCLLTCGLTLRSDSHLS